jgi:hypothetical protein
LPSTISRRVRRLRLALAAAGIVLLVVATTTFAAPSGLIGFLLRSGEQTGFSVEGRPAVQKSIKAVVNYGGGSRKQRQTITQLLTKGGFVAAADEHLRASDGRAGFSLVMEFESAASARAAATYLLKLAIQQQKGATVSRFKVKGVGAHGVLATGPNVVDTANLYWTEGRCAFGSGDFVPSKADAVSRPVITGAQSLFKRSEATCP